MLQVLRFLQPQASDYVNGYTIAVDGWLVINFMENRMEHANTETLQKRACITKHEASVSLSIG